MITSMDSHEIPTADRPAVSIKEACALAGINRRLMYRWIDLGRVDYVRTAGGAIRVYTESLVSVSSTRR